MDLSFLKNPIVLAILAVIITYAYMQWDNKQKQEKNPKVELPPIEYSTIGIVGLMTLFVAYGLFGFPKNNKDEVGIILNGTNTGEIVHSGGAKLLENKSLLRNATMSDRLTESFGSNTFHLVGKNAIRVPQTDVFIDIAKF